MCRKSRHRKNSSRDRKHKMIIYELSKNKRGICTKEEIKFIISQSERNKTTKNNINKKTKNILLNLI